MIITSKDLRKTLSNLWNIRDIWLTDRDFYTLDSSMLATIVKANSVTHKEYIPKIRECEEFARNLLYNIREYQALCYECSAMGKDHSNWAIGTCTGTKFQGVKENHTINIAVCIDGIFLTDPQNDNIWEADKNKDELYFITM